MEKDFLKELNSSQIKAVSHGEGPLLILAGPGSGKTRVIAHRIAYLVNNLHVPAENILSVTFTNKAAAEMKKRVLDLGCHLGGGMWIGTFHSICLRMLKTEADFLSGYTKDFVVYDQDDQLSLIESCLRELDYGEGLFVPKKVLFEFDAFENGKRDSFGEGYHGDELRNVYDTYKSELIRRNAMSFNDLLCVADRLLSENEELCARYQNRFRHVLVDEYQDTNSVQYSFARTISLGHRNIFVVGDDSQSIYGWRGADINNILNFERDFPGAKVVKLERNYRSTSTILDIANSVIARNRRKKEKNLWTENPRGEKAVLFRAGDSEDEARFVARRAESLVESGRWTWGDIAVFYRANFQSRVIEEALVARGIPYRIVSGVGFYRRAEIKDIVAYLRLIQNPNDDVSFERIVNVPPRRIGSATVAALREISKTYGFTLTDAVAHCGEQELMPRRAQSALFAFCAMMEEFRTLARSTPAAGMLSALLRRTDYMGYLGDQHQRVENVKELRRAAEGFGDIGLSDFLDLVLLSTDEDRGAGPGEKVSLMTIHAAKGLEFPAVFIVGVNQGLLPHGRAMGTPWGMEEERRLFYVAITRAKRDLFLSYVSRKSGSSRYELKESLFLDDIPPEYLTLESPRKELSGRLFSRPRRSSRKTPHSSAPPPSVSGDADSKLRPGQKVDHEVFGPGTVKQVDGKGHDAVVTVSFSVSGVKKIRASFLAPS